MTTAVRLIRVGVAFVGPNLDTTLPTDDGIIPEAGSFQALLTAATGVKPLIIGEPEPTMLVLGAKRLGQTRPRRRSSATVWIQTSSSGIGPGSRRCWCSPSSRRGRQRRPRRSTWPGSSKICWPSRSPLMTLYR